MLEAILGLLGLGLFGVLGWAFTISNRVSVLEADKVSLKELMESKLDDITRRLVSIERKLDKEQE